MSTPIDQTDAWKALQAHYEQIKDTHLRDFFAEDDQRGSTFALEHDGVYLDYSKNRLNAETLRLLHELAIQADLRSMIHGMFSGEKINTAEDRAALHVALRSPSDSHMSIDGNDVMPEVTRVLQKMITLAHKIRNGEWLGFSGKPVKNIVHIGIGGSEIGPHMACEALGGYAKEGLTLRFISNVDPANFLAAVQGLAQEETLFIIASKSFTTAETIGNAQTARTWLMSAVGDESAIAKHFVALSTNTEAVATFGIDPENMFEFWDWVGGRYSLMSAIGLSLMIAIGPENFVMMHQGAHSMDEHFRTAPLDRNMPVTLALIGMWYTNFFGTESELFVPYAAPLERFTTYFQQANMESNGKSMRSDGTPVTTRTGPLVWGTPGTDAQHTFMQHVHQGTHLIPAAFILFKEPHQNIDSQHAALLANALAQAEALAFGKTKDELKSDHTDENLIPHKLMPGNRPSNTLLLPKLTPYTLGQLVALYEHKIFVQGALWGINSFDQWGVQLGKHLAETILSELEKGSSGKHDSSTSTLIQKIWS